MMSSGDLRELVDSLSKAKTVEELHAACSKLCMQFGFACFNYGARFPSSFVKPYYVFICGYPSEWWSRYISNDYILIDPVVAHGVSHITPIRWDQLHSHKHERVDRVMDEARESACVAASVSRFTQAGAKCHCSASLRSVTINARVRISNVPCPTHSTSMPTCTKPYAGFSRNRYYS